MLQLLDYWLKRRGWSCFVPWPQLWLEHTMYLEQTWWLRPLQQPQKRSAPFTSTSRAWHCYIPGRSQHCWGWANSGHVMCDHHQEKGFEAHYFCLGYTGWGSIAALVSCSHHYPYGAMTLKIPIKTCVAKAGFRWQFCTSRTSSNDSHRPNPPALQRSCTDWWLCEGGTNFGSNSYCYCSLPCTPLARRAPQACPALSGHKETHQQLQATRCLPKTQPPTSFCGVLHCVTPLNEITQLLDN